MKEHDCIETGPAGCWCPPTTYLFGLLEIWPSGMWSIWCPQPFAMWVLRNLDRNGATK